MDDVGTGAWTQAEVDTFCISGCIYFIYLYKFKDAVSNSVFIASTGRVISEK
jgi:hypothetical protein